MHPHAAMEGIRGGTCPRWPGPAIPESWMISCEIANTDLQNPDVQQKRELGIWCAIERCDLGPFYRRG